MSNELNYVDYDFDELYQQLIDRVKLRDAWKDTYRSSTGQMLIELFAYVGNLVLYYIERRAEESYISTAKLKSSVVNLVRLLNYFPRRKTSATGVLTFSISSAHTKRIYVPKYTECQTVDGTKYLVSADAVIIAGQTSVAASGIQGELIELTRSGDGTANQEYQIEDTSVENSNLFIYVDDVEWTAVTSFVSSVNTSKHYKIRCELDDTITIIFGDNVFGMAPADGSVIDLKYIKSEGLDGCVYELDKVTTLNSTIYDEDGDAVENVSVTNSDTFLGGDDAEDIEEIRSEAPQVFQTGDRAVTKSDFSAIINNYAGVATSNVWGENDVTNPDYDMFNTVRICILLQDWAHPSITFKSELSDYLYTLSMITVKYEFVTAEIIYIIPTLDIKVVSGNSLSDIQSNVESALEDDFVIGDTAILGTSKRISDLVSIVDAVEGVSYHHMVLEIREELSFGYDSYYEYGDMLDMLSIKTSSVRVFIDDTLIATDDGAGGFTAEVGYTVTGEIDYTTGYIGVNVTPDVVSGETIYVRYQQDEDGDIVVDNNQICKIYDIDVTDISYDT